jgi:DNA-binding CsgD family transcriptional regulator
MPERFDKLTERQKDCLRFVSQGFEVKEIARALELSPGAVVERLRAARRVLGVETSRDAARLLAAHEGSTAYIRHVDMPPPLADVPYPLPTSGSSEPTAGVPGSLQVEEVSGAFVVLDPQPRNEPQRWPWPWRGRGIRGNDLTSSERLLASGGLMVAIGFCAAVTLIAVVLLMDFLVRISRHGG